jgi:hypothetical protein
VQLWSTRKGVIKKVNTDEKKQNSFGFYALKGKSVISSMGKGNGQNMVKMPTLIREANQEARTIIVIWDNHSAHLTALIKQTAQDLQIVLVNLPPTRLISTQLKESGSKSRKPSPRSASLNM